MLAPKSVCYRNEQQATTVDVAQTVTSSATEVERPKRLSLTGASVITVEGSKPVWNEERRFSVDVLSSRPSTVDRTQPPLSGRGRASTRTPRPPPPVAQTSQRRTSQPTPCRLRQLPGDICRRRCSDNDAAACSSCARKRRNDLETSATPPSTSAYTRRQSVQSNPPATARDHRGTGRRSSEGQGATQLNTWWMKSARRPSRDRQTEPLEQVDRKLPPWAVYRKRRSAPEVAFSERRESTSSGQQMTERRELQALETARRRRSNAVAACRLADDSFDSALMSGLPSPTDTDYSSAGSLSDIARSRRKDSGFRSIDTQSSYAASRKSSTSTAAGMRRQSIQTTTDVATGRHNSIPFVANPFELPSRSSRRPVPAGPRISGRRQSMFTRSDEVGSGGGDWLNEWLRWRSGTDVELPDFERQATSTHHGSGVWNSLSEKVERTFEGFDSVISRATALLHQRRMSTDSDNQIEF